MAGLGIVAWAIFGGAVALLLLALVVCFVTHPSSLLDFLFCAIAHQHGPELEHLSKLKSWKWVSPHLLLALSPLLVHAAPKSCYPLIDSLLIAYGWKKKIKSSGVV